MLQMQQLQWLSQNKWNVDHLHQESGSFQNVGHAPPQHAWEISGIYTYDGFLADLCCSSHVASGEMS